MRNSMKAGERLVQHDNSNCELCTVPRTPKFKSNAALVIWIFVFVFSASQFVWRSPFGMAQQPSNQLYLDFKGASLINVLIILSELTGINFVAGKEIAAREVNMVLDNVVIEDALIAISRGSNVSYEYFPKRNLYLFRTSAYDSNLPQLDTRVFKLYYIRASELREVEGAS